MKMTRSAATVAGPSDWFTGSVYLDVLAEPAEPYRIAASSVHFTPGARTAWHSHPVGQTLFVTHGACLCQSRGGPVEQVRPGERVYFEPGEEHWHGATADRLMTHIAVQQADGDGNIVSWGDHVSDEEYRSGAGS